MSFPRYPKYKDSGVEWLGQVPEHWRVLPLKRIVAVPITDGPHETPQFLDEGIPFVSAEAVSSGRIDFSKVRACISEEDNARYSQKYSPKRHDIYMVKSGATTGITAIVEDRTDFNIWSPLAVIRCGEYAVPLFVLNFMRSRNFLDAVTLNWSFGTQQNIGMGVIENLACTVPPIPEQTAIAAFLDRETAKIDELVAEQKKLMELLKEKRQAVISHAVTKGLNPNASMKPSGIEWLGDVPRHWEVTKMKWIAKMESGHTPDKKVPEYWEHGDIPWVSLNDTGYLKDNDYISDTAYTVSELGIANSSARILPSRVVVFSRDATIGRCAITTRPMAVSQHFIAWVCGESMIPEFLLLRLRSMTRELDRLTTGATLKTIGMPDVRTLVTPVPPQEEQMAIINWVSTLKVG